MSYRNRYNHAGRTKRNAKTYELIGWILIRLNQFDPIDVIRIW